MFVITFKIWNNTYTFTINKYKKKNFSCNIHGFEVLRYNFGGGFFFFQKNKKKKRSPPKSYLKPSNGLDMVYKLN